MRKKKPPDSDRQQLRQQTPPRLASPSPPPSPSWGPGGLQRDEATGSCAQWQVPPACSGPAPARCWWCWLAVNGPIRAHLGPLRSAARPPLCPRAHQTARLASFGATSLTGALSKKKKNMSSAGPLQSRRQHQRLIPRPHGDDRPFFSLRFSSPRAARTVVSRACRSARDTATRLIGRQVSSPFCGQN